MRYIYAFVELDRGEPGDYQHWVIPSCPLCGGAHMHGAGDVDEDVTHTLCARVPHCDHPLDLNYVLTTCSELNGKEVPPNEYHVVVEMTRVMVTGR